jgi:hypothetical protein
VAVPAGVLAYSRQWDSFLTLAVKRLARALRPVQRHQLADVFFAARYQPTQVAHSGASEPVLRRFLHSWEPIAPSCHPGNFGFGVVFEAKLLG